MTELSADVLVVGSEAAGARAAIAAAQAGASVLVATKGRVNRSGASLTATADLDVDSRACRDAFGLPGELADNPDRFFEDMLSGGKGINDQPLARVLVDDAEARVREAVDWGLRLQALIRTPGHRHPRGIITPGIHLCRVLARRMRACAGVRTVEDCMVLDLLPDGGGAIALDASRGTFLRLRSRAVVLATGGGMALYPTRTAPDELTGDGHAIAWRAGAELVDMEMSQFMPAVLLTPPAWRGIQFVYEITPGSTDGLAGWFLNRSGDRFMARWDPERMEKSTRDLVSIGIATEVVEGRGSPHGGVWFSLAHLPRELIDAFPAWYPLVGEDWSYEQFRFGDLIEHLKAGRAVEIGVGSHFFMGGVRISPDGATSRDGLFAAGELAGGVHGANRLSGNAITQALVQGERAGRAAAAWAAGCGAAASRDGVDVEPYERYLHRPAEIDPGTLRERLMDCAWRLLGPLRSADGLQAALRELDEIEAALGSAAGCRSRERIYNRDWIGCLELRNLIPFARAIARSGLLREESRGAHYRQDHPQPDPVWGRRNVVVRGERATAVPLREV